MVEVEDKKKKKSNPVNKIGTQEDEVYEEEIGRAIQMLSSLSMASMTIMQRSIT